MPLNVSRNWGTSCSTTAASWLSPTPSRYRMIRSGRRPFTSWYFRRAAGGQGKKCLAHCSTAKTMATNIVANVQLATRRFHLDWASITTSAALVRCCSTGSQSNRPNNNPENNRAATHWETIKKEVLDSCNKTLGNVWRWKLSTRSDEQDVQCQTLHTTQADFQLINKLHSSVLESDPGIIPG